MEDAALFDANATARVPTDSPCPTRHLAISPPYDWSRTYMAAKEMEEYLPGVPLSATKHSFLQPRMASTSSRPTV
jgi:hypothetical protein